MKSSLRFQAQGIKSKGRISAGSGIEAGDSPQEEAISRIKKKTLTESTARGKEKIWIGLDDLKTGIGN